MADSKAIGGEIDPSRFTKAEPGFIGGERAIKYTSESGETQYLVGGSRSLRNNNPGNLGCTDFSKRHGSIGCDGQRAIFPSVSAGEKAQKALLTSGNYKDKTLKDAIKTYAPPTENNTGKYTDYVTQKSGVNADTKMGNLTPDQLSKVQEAMKNYEGKNPPSVKNGSEIDNFSPSDKFSSEGQLPDWAASYIARNYGDGPGRDSGGHGGNSDGETLEREGEKVYRITPDGGTRGYFIS